MKGLVLLALCVLAPEVWAQTTVKYVHTDALGSVVAVTDGSGAVLEGRREYEPYGYQGTPAMQDGPGYTGHVQDAATGLVYMQQRYYDPGIGTFLSVDPVTAYSNPVGMFNRYRYANGNPYKFTDPDGRAGCAASRLEGVCLGYGWGTGAVAATSVRSQMQATSDGSKPNGVNAVQNAIPATVRSKMKKSWTDSESSNPTKRHEEGGYHGTEKVNGVPGARRWPTGSGSSITPPRRDPDGSYQGLNVKGEWHTHPNPPIDEKGSVWKQGGHEGDWNGIKSENYPGDSYIISDKDIYKIDNKGNETILGPRSDL